MSISALVRGPKVKDARCLPATSMLMAANLMVRDKVNALAVIDAQGQLSGIVTDQDVMRALVARNGKLDQEKVSGWMTSSVITCKEDTRLEAALRMMGRHRIRHLVVVDGQTPLGVVGIRDLLAKIHEDEELELQVLKDMAVVAR